MKAAAAALAFGAAFVTSASASAGDMDPATERFVAQPAGLPAGHSCQSIAAFPEAAVAAGLRPQDLGCRPDHASFQNMVSELGFAIAPNAFHPARTTGIGGFRFGVEASYTRISPGRTATATGGTAPYWQVGTRGAEDPNSRELPSRNGEPDSLLQIYTVKAMKGLPLGFELGGSLGYVANTSLWVVGGDLRWSLLEGFREGVLGYLPDVSLGGGVRTLTGTSRFYLTTLGVDVKLSKPIPLADSAQLIPTLGFQRLMIFGDSNVVDSTPNVDALDQCGFDGPNPTTGAPSCRNRYSNGQEANGDFANSFTFQKVRTHRNRALIGLHYKYEILWLGSQFAFDLSHPRDENPVLVGGRQWTLSFELGASF